MNIIQQHERARFLLDRVSTARFESEDIDNALNGEIESIVHEKYDQTRVQNRSDAFQRTQRVRDELRNLVEYLPFDHSDSVIIQLLDEWAGYYLWMPGNLAEMYRHLLSLKIKMNSGSIINAKPINQDQLNVREKNPFRRVRSSIRPKMYYHEIATPSIVPNGIVWQLVFDASENDFPVNPDGAEYYYLKNPTIVNYGIEYDSAKTFANGTKLIAVEQTVYAGTTYVIGEKFTITTPNYSITSGLVVANFVETELPVSLHEEICRRAASSLLISVGEFEKAKAILSQIIST